MSQILTRHALQLTDLGQVSSRLFSRPLAPRSSVVMVISPTASGHGRSEIWPPQHHGPITT